MDKANISTGKGKYGGYAYRAPLGTTLPTDATTALGDAFEDLGYISEDGLRNNGARDNTELHDWAGALVDILDNSFTDSFGCTFIESVNPVVLKAVHGSGNVTTQANATTVTVNGAPLEPAVYVFEVMLKGGKAKRIVIPEGVITEVAEVSYTSGDPVGYECTIMARATSAGTTHIEYIA